MKSPAWRLGLAGLAVATSVSGIASAQTTFGKRLDIALGIERAFGFYTGESQVEPPNGPEQEYDSQGFALGWAHTRDVFPVYTPRFSFDIFVIDSLSVGAGFGFVSQDNDDDFGGDGRGGVIFAPRVGYFIDFSRHFGFWPRGGFTLYDLDDPDQSQGLLTLEGNFTFAPREGFGFLFGPALDLGFTGDLGDSDLVERSVGVTIGMFGWL